MPMTELAEQSGRAASYGRDIRGIVRALWNGSIDDAQAYDLLYSTITIGLRRAAEEGTKACGIKPSEWSIEEKVALEQAVVNERGFIYSLIDDVRAGSQANGGKFSAFETRISLWASRYDSVKMTLGAMACGDKKMMWRLGPTKEHCRSCLALAGKVKRYSTWRDTVLPQNFPNEMLICKGAGGCELVPADDFHLSPGPLPRLP